MYFLCLNCGEINQNEELCCRNCGSELDTKEYNHLMEYSKRAFEYGFDYRLAYEEQVKNYGEVKVKFSLVSPENYQTWMAAAALSGMIGNLAYDLVKYVGKKIIEQLKTKEEPLNYSEKIIIEIISDNNKLIQFTNYIQGYYKGNSKLNKEVEKATYSNVDSIINVLKPEMKVFHDIHDHYSRNHHEIKNSLKNVAKFFSNTDDVEAELQIAADLLDRYNDPDSLNVVVKSNHDEALDRWLREANIDIDPRNAQFFHYLKYHQLKNMKIKPNGRFETIDLLEFWCRYPDKQRGLKCIDNTVFLKRDQSLMVNGIELGFHGDVGPNGARGSIQNLSKLGNKMIVRSFTSSGNI